MPGNRGGVRPGAGRPPGNRVHIQLFVSKESYEKLVLLAKGKPRYHTGFPRLGDVVDDFLLGVPMPESKARQLAREAGLLGKP